MKRLTVMILSLIFFMVPNTIMAMQEVKDAAIVDFEMNHQKKVCTITIDRDVPTDAATEKCTQRAFSWKCFNDDYLWHMVLHIHKQKLQIDVRYSSDKCFDETNNNFQLLTVW